MKTFLTNLSIVIVMAVAVIMLSSFGQSYHSYKAYQTKMQRSSYYGWCNSCNCKHYTPGPLGTTYCKCGHSKHSHIGM